MAQPQSGILKVGIWQHQKTCEQKIVTIREYRLTVFNQTHTLFMQAPHPILSFFVFAVCRTVTQ